MTELTPREKQLLRRLAAGKSDQEIAISLRGTLKQVAEQRARLLGKLGINSPAQIADAAKKVASWPNYRGVT